MPTILEYMQFATGVYAASDRNSIADPTDWTLNAWQPDTLSGFSAGYYFNSQTNEVVISYTGTNDWIDKANWTTGAGLPLPQIFDAVTYYFNVKAAHPNSNITFTGHSLGGGLASMMAVFFDKQATVFDEAPFQLAAISPFVLPFIGAEMLIAGYQDEAFSTYLLSGGLLALTRESNVIQYYVEGEVLNSIRISANTLVGSDYIIPMGNSTAGAVDRHSMALMTALWKSPAFLTAAQRLPDLVTELLDSNLFATDSTDPNKADLLRRLLRHQLGVNGAVQPDGMLDRFAADMNKLAQDGGLTLTDKTLSKALMDFAMQMYYENPKATAADKELFSKVSGGIRFNREDVAASLSDAQGCGRYFLTYLPENFTGSELEKIMQELPSIKDWYIQAGGVSMGATGGSERAFMLGGTGQDRLTGGGAADLIVGGKGEDTLNGSEGNDILIGGEGDDTLIGGSGTDTIIGGADADILTGGTEADRLEGGEGNDTYVHRDGDGADVIRDADGQGSIKWTGADGVERTLSGGHKIAPTVWQSDDEQFDYWFQDRPDGSKNLLISNGADRLIVEQWQDGALGIALENPPTTPDDRAVIRGDQYNATFPIITVPYDDPRLATLLSMGFSSWALPSSIQVERYWSELDFASYDSAHLVGSVFPSKTTSYQAVYVNRDADRKPVSIDFTYTECDSLGNTKRSGPVPAEELLYGQWDEGLWGSRVDDRIESGNFGNLAPVIAMLDVELAAEPQAGRVLVNEFGHSLRGLKLTGEATNDYNYDLEMRAA